ncbi:MAG: FIST C-terminal domain-containing protein [Clostridiales Family XIII bacterium]|jgi:hypothetical protein|nr:FIST C-terminal domain-containing protein [Clostridiales Family XIII bacterium]
MIKMQTAFTTELDDPQTAAEDILSQLDLDALPSNNVGIITFYQDAPETGVLAAISEALPFESVGGSVLSSGTEHEFGFEQVSVAVLSSDDVKFSIAVSGEITTENAEDMTRACYRDALSKLDGPPSLIFAFTPMSENISGDRYVLALDDESEGVPVFGTIANAGLSFDDARVVHNGEAKQFIISLLLFSGDVNPRFFTTAISDSNITRKGSFVTESDGYYLRKINNVAVEDYLVGIGVVTGNTGAIAALPILIDYKDGTKPTAYNMYSNTENGTLVGGPVPVGSEIVFADVDYDSIMSTADDALKMLLSDIEQHGASAVFIIPCLSRCLTLGHQSEDEMKKTAEVLGQHTPYLFLYSGGEFCPVSDGEGKLVNRFHNMTYTALVLD